MPFEVTGLPREFRLKKKNETVTLEDPNPAFTAPDVIRWYSNQHSELTTATIDGPKIEGGKQVYEFKTTVGTKG